ncbi:glycosyltransferase family 4 protein [Citricoccus sp. NPDC079358]|uniref:glycosyltransferase family 4 protein n=1 Tax=Citricoccus sp. NPDC079358 TaxID=3154653 RepID=UPI00344E9C41
MVLSQFYRPEPFLFAPAIAEDLAAQGFQVSVVTGYPNRPGGTIYSGYRQRLGFNEEIEGIEVHRAPLVINHSQKAVERIANFLTFSIGALTVSHKIRDADAVYVYATPATAGIPAQVWKLLFGIPYVLHVQDLWPESVTDSGMMGGGRISRAASAVMKPWLERLYGGAATLIAISPGMRQLLIDRGNSPDACDVVFNWADESTIAPKKSSSFSEDDVHLIYAGNLGPMQDLETVIQAAGYLDDEEGFNLIMAGGGILEDRLRDQAASLTKTSLVGRLPRSKVGELYLKSDFQLVTLKDLPIFRTTVPSKLQASLASGVPVITTVKGDVAQLIREHDAGLVAEPGDARSLAEAFRRALSMTAEERARMGRNARMLYEEHMSKRTGLDAIVSILDTAVRSRSEGSLRDRSVAHTEMKNY